jgi:hypothetical protein
MKITKADIFLFILRAEFEGWCLNNGLGAQMHHEGVYYKYAVTEGAWQAWQSCQQLNDKRIAAKDAEIARLREALGNKALNQQNERVEIAGVV